MKTTLQVQGVNEANAMLDASLDAMRAKNVEHVLLQGARIFRDEWRRRAPRGQTGNLIRGIKAKIGKRRGQFIAGAFAAIDRKIAPHTHLVLDGTRPHLITAKVGKALRFGGRFYESLRHPGSKPNPFTDEGVAARQAEVLMKIEQDIGELLDRVK